MKYPAFETTSLLYVTPTDCTPMQELLMQEHKHKLYKTCSCCRRDSWHIKSKHILQPPKYLIIIVNRITYSNNRITKNKSRIYIYIYDCVFGSCNYVSADGGRDGLWWPALPGHWLWYIPDVDNLWLLCIDFYVWGAVSILTTSLWCICPRILLFE